ncbi:hypothetical protein CBM2599_B50558 [Cupriavidus taiwanensis]|nr:hypothetical protein CBM2600_B10431 [Cupriavidus taiwanensis]SOY96626.1 hypothetical protein CBM2599_B50558 [Cupriavidus taiwanensis]
MNRPPRSMPPLCLPRRVRATPHAAAKVASLTRSETVARTYVCPLPVCRGSEAIRPHGTNLAPKLISARGAGAILRRFLHMAFYLSGNQHGLLLR